MLAALAEGISQIEGFLDGEDTRATAAAFAAMGVRIDTEAQTHRRVHGVGLRGLQAPAQPLDCGNAGTGMRLLAGILAAQAFDSTLVGDASLSRRPMRRVIEPLAAMGAQIDAGPGGLPPLRIHGARRLHAIRYRCPVASAQVKSCILLAGLYADGETCVLEPHPTRDHTERMLASFGHRIRSQDSEVALRAAKRLEPAHIQVPADFSSAAFLAVAATLVPGSELELERVGVNPRRTGLLQALQLMGADIALDRPGMLGAEPVANLRVRHAPLQGIVVPPALVPDMIDELPILFVAAAAARGTTVVTGAGELRVKESDRIATMTQALRALGVDIEERGDGALIHGRGHFEAGVVDSHGDHRVAMSLAVAAQLARGPVRIRQCANVSTSFPGFLQCAGTAGIQVDEAVD